jgi:predicted anti-sigma-YlaC factor YlaD
MYANAFVQGPAALYPSERYEERQAANERAQRLYLRGAGILAEALERRFPRYERDFADGKPAAALKKAAKGDAALFYWTAAATLSAWSIDPLDIALGRRLPLMLSLIDTAYRLDPDFNGSALDELYLLIYASLPEAMGGDKELAAVWFNRALEKSAFLSAGPYIAWAEAVAIPAQDYGLFRDCLEKALAIDADKNKTIRMANLLSQRKARFLLDNATHYFIDTGEDAFDWEADG